MNAVFVSASVPDPMRKPVYFDTADNVAIRDAITALVQVVTPTAKLVFGGHPAITPMVARVARTLGTLGNVVIFQSAEFAPMFPEENNAFASLRITQKLASQGLSLERMRAEMIHYARFDAAFFIGGMEGVEDEWAAVRALKAPPPCYPVASTGGAALRLAREYGRELNEATLRGLYREYKLLRPIPRSAWNFRQRSRRGRPWLSRAASSSVTTRRTTPNRGCSWMS